MREHTADGGSVGDKSCGSCLSERRNGTKGSERAIGDLQPTVSHSRSKIYLWSLSELTQGTKCSEFYQRSIIRGGITSSTQYSPCCGSPRQHSRLKNCQ